MSSRNLDTQKTVSPKNPGGRFRLAAVLVGAVATAGCADIVELDGLKEDQSEFRSSDAMPSTDRADGAVNTEVMVDADASSPADVDAGVPVDVVISADRGDSGVPVDMVVVQDRGQDTGVDTGIPTDVPTDRADVVVPPVDMPIMPTDTGTDSGVDTGVDTGNPIVDVPVDTGNSQCRPTALSIGMRIGTTNVVNTTRPGIAINYTGDCSNMMGRPVPFRIPGLGFPYTQDVQMTTVDTTTRTMRGVLDFGLPSFSDFPRERAGIALEAAPAEGVVLSTTFNRDVVQPVFNSSTRINHLSAGSERYRFTINGDSVGKVYITMLRERDNLPLFENTGTLSNCVVGNTVLSCPSDSLGADQVCHYTVTGANACVASRLVFDVQFPHASTVMNLPDADYRRALGLVVRDERIRVHLVYCDTARNCASQSTLVTRTD